MELHIPHPVFWILLIVALVVFFLSIQKRVSVLRKAQRDPRFDRPKERLRSLIWDGILQSRQPRYLFSGIMHLIIFWGFVVLGLRSLQLLLYGLNIPFLNPFKEGGFWSLYGTLKDLFEIAVLFTCIILIGRRAIFRPDRYKGSKQFEAYLVLGLISFLMITDIVFDLCSLKMNSSHKTLLGSFFGQFFMNLSLNEASFLFNISFLLHIMTFLFFLNLLPLSKHFHIITALPNVFFRKLKKGAIKPVRYDLKNIEELDYLGTKFITDLTWKHILDIYSCTECGRCSDNCPANLSGRELSPKLLTLKLRDSLYKSFPLFGSTKEGQLDLIPGNIVSEEEIWSCTTCGACERECPVFIEYIDKIVDMRRYLIEQGEGPTTFNQVFMNMEKTGNPFGKPPAKRAEWVKEQEGLGIRVLKKGEEVTTLLFVDSYPSFDPKANEVAASVARGLHLLGEDYGILGPLERDSGHQVRRMGEEGLFELLRDQNKEVFQEIGFKRIVTVDPHSFNTLRNDYELNLPVYHYSEFFFMALREGRLKLKRSFEGRFTYHDPCYLGRHNAIFEEPRELLNALIKTTMVEMKRNRDRSFCCGGGDVVLWHEVKEQERMASKRVKMAMDVGAEYIVTACPFCLIHLEDAVKTMGLEDRIEVVDLMSLIIRAL